MSTDILDAVAAYAPTGSAEWTPERQDTVLAAIVGGAAADGTGVEIPLQYRPRPGHRRRPIASLTATAAALTAAAAAVVAVTLSGTDDAPPAPTAPVGRPFDPPAGLSDRALPTGRYAGQVTEVIVLGDNGKPGPGDRVSSTSTSYVSADGREWLFRDSAPRCLVDGPAGHPGFDTPSRAFFAGLPTDVPALTAYLRGHVHGSSSRDEAVFVAVGDALRTAGALASPRLRAALVAVLSRTPGVTVREGVRDYLGRPAIRADFVNQAIRPDEVQSLYFDPTDFALLGDRDGENGAPARYAGPSPAYTAPAPAGGIDPVNLTGRAYVQMIEQRHVVGRLPHHGRCR